jgi:hypothetical protein
LTEDFEGLADFEAAGVTVLATGFEAGFVTDFAGDLTGVGLGADLATGLMGALAEDFSTGLAAVAFLLTGALGVALTTTFATGFAGALAEVFGAGFAAAIVFLLPVDKVMIALLSHVLRQLLPAQSEKCID